MKKYIQIIGVLGAFFLLVFIKNYRGDAQATVIGAQNALPTVSQPDPTVTFTPTNTAKPSSAPSLPLPTAIPTPVITNNSKYKDGSFTGSVEDAYYGNMQVQAVISGGKLVDITPLQYPNDNRTSLSINSQAFPMLKDEALKAQSSQIDMISGASDSSPAFARSLSTALKLALK